MQLLNDFVKTENLYLNRLSQIQERVEIWIKQISEQKRIGLPLISQLITEKDPYNTADAGTYSEPEDTVEFKPSSEPIAKPENHQPISGGMNERLRLHLIYNPKTGEIESSIKTPALSRPPSQYIEANADQISGAIKHLEKLNPKLADLLVAGRMSVWIPRSIGNIGPSNVKHLGLNTNPKIHSRGNSNVANMSDHDLAKARDAANQMKIS